MALVAGGAGFLGSHLCDRLLAGGRQVICVDNLATGCSQNIAHLAGRDDFIVVAHDITGSLPELPAVDEVYHLASPASPTAYRRLATETLRANSVGTENLLEAARRNGASFLFASTSEVYGDPLVHPQPEDYRGNVSTTGPRSMYDEGKRYGEALTMAWALAYGVDVRIVRIFNSYGPRMSREDGRLVPTFIDHALRGAPLPVHGDGHQTRSLCYVTDTVEGIVTAMEAPAARGEVLNIGSPEEHTVFDFALMVREVAGSAAPIAFVPHEVGDDPRRRCPDITRAERLLGWRPLVSLEEGLRKTCEWFRQETAAGAAAC